MAVGESCVVAHLVTTKRETTSIVLEVVLVENTTTIIEMSTFPASSKQRDVVVVLPEVETQFAPGMISI